MSNYKWAFYVEKRQNGGWITHKVLRVLTLIWLLTGFPDKQTKWQTWNENYILEWSYFSHNYTRKTTEATFPDSVPCNGGLEEGFLESIILIPEWSRFEFVAAAK